ncbi:hypothetical protein RchiOBHm_Chr4g0387461 [Rosa chinensis]|uniref:Uncharacterized protein n=1 Tax=Rosa chinensis TaxID=74649 RepID=A0A2P6QPK8_ROSCH|nr:hypothetical protein RchiOBHm_Chr4g0387461 [Rosa chinensis]
MVLVLYAEVIVSKDGIDAQTYVVVDEGFHSRKQVAGVYLEAAAGSSSLQQVTSEPIVIYRNSGETICWSEQAMGAIDWAG